MKSLFKGNATVLNWSLWEGLMTKPARAQFAENCFMLYLSVGSSAVLACFQILAQVTPFWQSLKYHPKESLWELKADYNQQNLVQKVSKHEFFCKSCTWSSYLFFLFLYLDIPRKRQLPLQACWQLRIHTLNSRTCEFAFTAAVWSLMISDPLRVYHRAHLLGTWSVKEWKSSGKGDSCIILTPKNFLPTSIKPQNPAQFSFLKIAFYFLQGKVSNAKKQN